jgi:hypothetical protein
VPREVRPDAPGGSLAATLQTRRAEDQFKGSATLASPRAATGQHGRPRKSGYSTRPSKASNGCTAVVEESRPGAAADEPAERQLGDRHRDSWPARATIAVAQRGGWDRPGVDPLAPSCPWKQAMPLPASKSLDRPTGHVMPLSVQAPLGPRHQRDAAAAGTSRLSRGQTAVVPDRRQSRTTSITKA